ncbi:TPA: DUF2750 domain-containing protein [Vibrio vulnificus]|nr:DUF2750 domain-containing protein [Vibrio cholerae]HAS6199694.1 DUF2750 domain-containing protein [Vibrio vulnificus]HAT7741756.1 DUF2750 domain-containing protein [Vibrio vulnificus]HDY8072241.1 DUF2750 domain-containing protein [Vibrio vulnificus]
MTTSALKATAFYKEVAKNRVIWTCRDAKGFPAPFNSDGLRAMPFWSSLSRVQNSIVSSIAYESFEPIEISWETFVEKWAVGLARDGLLVGVNWSGENSSGYDLKPAELVANVEYYLQKST